MPQSTLSKRDTSIVLNPRLRVPFRVAWVAIAVMAFFLTLISIPAYLQDCGCPANVVSGWDSLGITQPARNALTFTNTITFIATLLVSFIIFWRRPDDRMAIVVSLTFLFIAGSSFSSPTTSPEVWYHALRNSFLTMTFVMLLLFFYWFPEGQFPHRWQSILYFTLIPVFIVTFNIHTSPFLEISNMVLTVLLIGGLSAGISRYRNGTPLQRQQMKWVLFAVGIMVVSVIISAIMFTMISDQNGQSLVALTFHLISLVLIFVLAAAIGIAILRYRLWDIDLTINRSLVGVSVTAVLVVVFLGILLFTQSMLGEQQSPLPMLLAAVAVGGLFNPSRKIIRSLIDRRLYGFRFDLNQLAAMKSKPEVKQHGAYTGRVLGGYELLDVIGKGGMGEVYKAYADGRTVAVKILPSQFGVTPEYLARFERESQVMSLLDHPHIIKLYAAGEENGLHYMVMEFIEGEELAAVIRRQSNLSPEAAREIFDGLCAALSDLHSRGLVHRDLKPSNIMLRLSDDNETYKAVLMDFGIAKIGENITNLTGTGAIGTIDYMAPEQIMAAREVDHRADIYALGVILYEMLTGERPFQGGPGQILFAHLQHPAPNPCDIMPDLPRPLGKAIMKALAKAPEDRFQSAQDFFASMSAYAVQ